MTPWFSGQQEGSSPPPRVPVKDVVKNLYQSASSRLDRSPQEKKSRFSTLLLEYGERHLQDWAVVASSEVSKQTHPTSTTSRKTQWNQTGRPGRSKKVGPNQSVAGINKKKTKKNSATVVLPSMSMRKIEGRLHLCSRSLVLEPVDKMRGIIRCPFARMGKPPREIPLDNNHSKTKSASSSSSSFLSGSYETITPLTVEFECGRHFIMMENNLVGPSDNTQTPTKFRFTFLHSAPEDFVELCQRLYSLIEADTKDESALDDIMKPMLNRTFDPSNLVDVREKLQTSNLRCSLVTPLQKQPGCAIVTGERLYFQSASGVLGPIESSACTWLLSDILAVARRYNGLRDCAIEIYWKDGSSVLLAFEREREREKIFRVLPKNIWCHTNRDFVEEVYREWQKGNMSNYDYLMALNSAAGRTFHDLSRYPVFPWVLADYQSKTLDLNSEESFRDLTKPVGALNDQRLEYFRARLSGMQDMEDSFLYGTHYSAPGYVLYYLVRSMPEHMLCLQNGKFDAPDRMFYSIKHCFSCALTNHADVKELIPEFFNPTGGFDFLINARNLQLGAMQTGDRVNDVNLPRWAKSPRDFLRKNRKALESERCTKQLPKWIDLIFGVHSRGDNAKDSSNLFHPSAYLGPADLSAMSDRERFQAELQAVEFGIVPDMLFAASHPTHRDTSVDTSDFISATLGKVPVGSNGEGEALNDGDSSKHGEQAWELLDSPSRSNESQKMGSSDSGRLFDDTKSRTLTPNVGFGAAAIVSSHETKKFASPQPATPEPRGSSLATPVGKAKASWAASVPATDSFEPSSADLGYRAEDHAFSGHRSNPKPDGIVQPVMTGDSNAFGYPQMRSEAADAARSLPLSGSGELSKRSTEPGFGKTTVAPTQPPRGNQPNPTTPVTYQGIPKQVGWDMKVIEKSKVHTDSVSGCSLLFLDGQQDLLTTVSLDGSLLVHVLDITSPAEAPDNDISKRGLVGTFSRFPYIGLSQARAAPRSKLTLFRKHTASDPLACLSLTNDGSSGHVVFAGGHDDVVLAYGISSACAVASVYSHRDAVTGLHIIQRPPLLSGNALWTDISTHLMVSGSWDATVKVWSVAVASGETVSINREPLAELFDADSTIVCLAASYVVGTGLAIGAGCSDGSFVVWLCHDDGTKVVIHKEPARRGSGPCNTLVWAKQSEGVFLFAGFSTGRLASYQLSNGILERTSAVSIGVAVKCLEVIDGGLLAGCADGGLRLLPLRDGASFDGKPTLWNAVNGKSSPALTCVNSGVATNEWGYQRLICSTGAEDGSVTLFELKKAY